MATIGLSKPFYAIYAASGATVSYANGGILGKAVELSMELDGGDANIPYADNGPAESATTFGGGTLTITTDDLLPEPAAILGLTLKVVKEQDDVKEIVFGEGQSIPYVGFGVVVKKQQSGTSKWMGVLSQGAVPESRHLRHHPGREHRMADQGADRYHPVGRYRRA